MSKHFESTTAERIAETLRATGEDPGATTRPSEDSGCPCGCCHGHSRAGMREVVTTASSRRLTALRIALASR